MSLIYCVEDDDGVRELLLCALKTGGFEAKGITDGSLLFRNFSDTLPDLIMLDIMLPGEDGISILARLRADRRTKAIPVIMLTAKSTELDKVVGLEAGADDYITKPFGVMELLSRVKAVLRRTAAPAAGETDVLRYDKLILDPGKHTVLFGEEPVELTLKEFELLRFLMNNRGMVLTRDRIIERVWGYDFAGESRTIDMHIKTLRKKLSLAGCPELILTVRGVGYKFEV